MNSEIDPLVPNEEMEQRPKMCGGRVRSWFIKMLLLTLVFSVLFGMLVQIWLYYQSLSDDLDTSSVSVIGFATFCNRQNIQSWNVRDCNISNTSTVCTVLSDDNVQIMNIPPKAINSTFENNRLEVDQVMNASECVTWLLFSLPI